MVATNLRRRSALQGGTLLLRALVLALSLVECASAHDDARAPAWQDPAQQEPGKQDPAAAAAVDPAELAARLDAARARVGGLATDQDPESAAGRLLQAWQRRVLLLEEIGQQLEQQSAGDQEEVSAGLEARQAKARAELAALTAAPPAPLPAQPTKEDYDELDAQIARLNERVVAASAERARQQLQIEQTPELVSQAREREAAATERLGRLTESLAAAPDPAEREILETRIENAVQDALAARMTITGLGRERELARASEPVLADEQQLAERRLEVLREFATRFRGALEERLTDEQEGLQQQLAQRLQELAAAQGPAQRALAAWKVEIARSENDAKQFDAQLLSLRSDLDDQQRRLTAEAEELKNLREYLKRAGTGEAAADRIKFTLKRVQLRRQVLKQALGRDQQEQLRARRFELEDRLFGLTESWQQETDAVAAELPEAEAAVFRVEAAELLEPFRSSARADRDMLTEIISVGQQLQVTALDRRKAADELEAFIRSRVFWIRDGRPIGPELFQRLEREVRVVGVWLRDLGSERVTSQVGATLGGVGTWVTAFFLFLVLPIALFLVRQRLRRFVTRQNDRTIRRDATFFDRLLAIGAGVLSIALLPTFLLIAAELVAVSGFGDQVAPVASGLLFHLAVALFFWFLSRSFFAGRGTAQVQFGIDPAVSHALHRAIGLALLGYLCFALRDVLSRPPFLLDGTPLEALPRLFFTVFLVLEVTAAISLLQPRSQFSQRWRQALGPTLLGRSWGVVGAALCVAGLGVVGLEVAGYRYGAHMVARDLALSVGTLFLMFSIYRGVLTALDAYARGRAARRAARVRSGEEEPGDGGFGPDDTDSGTDELQVARFVRLVFVVVGLLLVASYWGINEQAFQTLDEWKAFEIRDTGDIDEYVSYGDLLRALLLVVGTWFLLRFLPGIYEYAIFPRLRIDSGLKYAILTISRYTVFTLGVFLSLSAIHLDLGRLSWLMAAVGVGLGFGLQEIVSNFVSGIILLVERPVRVGDLVTVGPTSGRVQRINIRATTVLNFDRQEIIIPNRSLITQDVTNWTRGDTIVRLIIPIGVAYGSDVDEVTALLLELARAEPEVLAEPEPQALFLSHGESSLDFELRVFVPDPGVKLGLQHKLNRSINLELARRGIEIPFPQRDVHIRTGAVS